MTRQQQDVVDKRRWLRQEYGGLMSLKQLTRELGLKDSRAAKQWAVRHSLRYVRMPSQGGLSAPRFDTDHFAKLIMADMLPGDTLR